MQAQPIDDQELDRLANLLHALDAAPLEWVDGYFSALIVGPVAVPLEEYLAGVWGEEGPPKDMNEVQFSEALRLLMRLWEHIVWRVEQPVPEADTEHEEAMAGVELLPFFMLPGAAHSDPDGSEAEPLEAAVAVDAGDPADPLADAEFEGFPFASAWALGFLSGQELRPQAWQMFLQRNPDLAEDMQQVLQLAVVDDEDLQRFGLVGQPLLDFDARVEASTWIPQMLEQMNLQREQDQSPQQIVRDAPKTGRNDPCPCGSGLKFKKCCGDSGRALH